MECLEVLKKMYEVLDNPGQVEPSPEAQAHLETCPNCQKLLQLDRSVKEVVRLRAATVSAPLGLATRIRQEIEDLESLTWQKKLSWLVPGRPWGWAGAASVMVVLLLLIGIWTLRVQPSVTEWFLEEHAEYVSQGFDLDVISSDPKEVDAWFKKNVGLEPEAARFLITGFEIEGGKKMEFAGLTSALACLKKGEKLISVYAVPTAELAVENLESRKVGEKEVWVGSHDKFNIVVWKDKARNETWGAVAAIPLDELLALAEAA